MKIEELEAMKRCVNECITCKDNRNCVRSRTNCANLPVTDVEIISIIDELIELKEKTGNGHFIQQQILASNIKKNGVSTETTIAMEELSELIQAISKCKRYGCSGKVRENLIEEIADVKIIIEELMMIYGVTDTDLSEWYNYKIRRLKSRL